MSNGAERIEIYLVPGFLGFERIAGLEYFIDVPRLLERRLREVDIEAAVHATATIPSGSIRKRAAKLANEVAARHDPSTTSVHFVGHSTGGLDVRLLLSPESNLVAGRCLRKTMGKEAFERYTAAMPKVRTAVGVATPHYGTPIADLAVRLSFDALLKGISHAVRQPGIRDALALVLQPGVSLAAVIESLPAHLPFLEWLATAVFRNSPLAALGYLEGLGADVGALRNLTQEGTDLADALLLQRQGVTYGSVVTGTSQPAGPIHADGPLLYANTVWFRAAWALAVLRDPDYGYAPRVNELQSTHDADRAAGLDVGALTVDERTNDGVVPSASQAHETILGVFASDHLDCVGHFPHTRPNGKKVSGWVRSGAGFTPRRFDLMWGRVAAFVARALGKDLPDTAPPPQRLAVAS